MKPIPQHLLRWLDTVIPTPEGEATVIGIDAIHEMLLVQVGRKPFYLAPPTQGETHEQEACSAEQEQA